MKKRHYIILVFILAGFNIVLLYANTVHKNQIQTLQTQVNLLNSFERSVSKTGEIEKNIKLTHENIERPESGLSLVLILNDGGCNTCVDTETYFADNLYQRFEDQLDVYYLGSNKSYLDDFQFDFPVKSINSGKAVLNIEFNFENPVALLIDEKGIVQYISVAEVGNANKSKLFYQRIASLFESTIE